MAENEPVDAPKAAPRFSEGQATAKDPAWSNIAVAGIKLDWIRAIIFKVGGRKAALALGGGYVIRDILSRGYDWQHIAAAGIISFTAVGIAFAIAWEDAARAHGAAAPATAKP